MKARLVHNPVVATCVALTLLSGCQSAGMPSASVQTSSQDVAKLIYAAQDDGTIHVYDISHSHRLLRIIPVFDCCADVRGITAAVPTQKLYVMYNRVGEGRVAAIDLGTDRVAWNKLLHSPGVDRGNVSPDGRTLYLPTWESDPKSDYELVIDARTGNELKRVAIPPLSHDTIVSLDGKRVFMETKSATAKLHVVDAATNEVVGAVEGYCCDRVLGPFSINGRYTTVVNDVYGFYGFQVGDVTSGRVIASVPFTGTTGTTGHGIAWTPNEREVWVNDGSNPIVHVFDMTTAVPTQTHLVTVSNPGPHWITFSIDGRFAYVAGRKGAGDPTDIVDSGTYQVTGSLSASEDLLEVDFSGGAVVAVGNQFGVGRVVG